MMKLITSMGILMFFSNPYLLVLGISSIVILLITSFKHDEIYLYPSSILVWDNLAMIMILLTLWVTLLMLLTNMSSMQKFMSQTMSPKNYLSMKSNSITVIIFLMISLIFTFSMNSIIQFYIMFEITLIPTFILIMGWGSQPERLQAGLYLLLYTVFFSLPLLVSILFLSYINSTDLMLMLNPLNYSFKTSIWTFLFTLAFLVKLPIYSLHLWLPKAHVEAPVEGSMILAGVLLKLGGYGLIRIIPILKTSISPLKHIYISWAILGGLYAGVMCLAQMDIKLLIALSSVAHMSLVASGLMSLNKWGLTGSVLLMVAHGLSSSAMFCLNNMIYERMHSRSLLLLKGLSTLIPFFALSWFITVMANMAVPPSMNLVSEIMLLISIQSTSYFYLLPLASSIFISALYSLFLYSFTSHGKTLNSMFTFENLSLRESLISLLHLIPTFIPIFSLKIMLLYL